MAAHATPEMPQASTKTINVSGEQAGQRLDRVLAAAHRAVAHAPQGADPRRRGHDRRPHDPRSGLSRQRGRDRRGRGAGAGAGRARRREHPAQHRVRGRRDHRHRQAGRPGGASGGGPRHRHAGQRADRALRRQPVRHRRGEAAGHRAPARQGHHRADGGGQDRRGAPVAGRAVRRPRPHRPAAARLSGVRLGRAGAPEGHHRRADRPPSQEPRPDGGPRQRPRSPSPIGRCWSASTARTASRSRA